MWRRIAIDNVISTTLPIEHTYTCSHNKYAASIQSRVCFALVIDSRDC
jgi:hypothetical protein